MGRLLVGLGVVLAVVGVVLMSPLVLASAGSQATSASVATARRTDPPRCHLENFPRALSHLALINALMRVIRSEEAPGRASERSSHASLKAGGMNALNLMRRRYQFQRTAVLWCLTRRE